MQQLDDTRLLQSISRVLIENEDVSTLYPEIIDTAIALMRSDAASFQLLNPDNNELELLAWKGFHPDSAEYWKRVTVDSGAICGDAHKSGKRQIVPDVRETTFPEGTKHLEHFYLSNLFAVQSTPLFSRNGRLVGMISTHWRSPHEPSERELSLFDVLARQAADVLESRHEQQKLKQSEERLRLALAAAQMGTWSWSLSTGIHRRDANFNQLLGLSPVEKIAPIEQFYAHIHPGDGDRVRAAFTASIQNRQSLRVDFRILRPDGQIRWLSNQGDVFGQDLQRYLAGVCVDITDRKRMEETLHEADRRKDEFLAMLAHELRNPLAPIRSAVEILKHVDAGEVQSEPVVEMIERQVDQVVRLVDDLLDVSRISKGKIELRKEPIDLAAVIQAAIEIAQPLCQNKNQEMIVTSQSVYVNGDPLRLAQVVGNLLNNACKFTDAGGRVLLSVGQEDEQAVVRVKDNGIGIAADQLVSIFEIFTQVDASKERSHGGLGLGLTLVKSLVEMHQGTIEAKSAGIGHGSEFVLRLPLTSKSLSQSPTESAASKEIAKSKRRILVVDDNRDAAQSLATLLELSGHEVNTSHDGLHAIEDAGKLQPDVILLDIGLPGLNGYEAARRIRAQWREHPLTLIALTGWGQEEDRRLSAEAGFDAHLVKPVDVATLTKLLDGSNSH